LRKDVRICIDARIIPGHYGGVEQFIVGLAKGLSSLADGDEKYFFLTYTGLDDWLAPYVTGSSELLRVENPASATNWINLIASNFPAVKHLAKTILPLGGKLMVPIPRSDGTVESANIDLMHFSFQKAFLTNIPSIFHPHDLQHIHFPHFFSRWDRLTREVLYRSFCNQAEMVSVASSWTKNDLVKYLGLPSEKIKVVPLAPTTEAYDIPSEEDLLKTRAKYALPRDFVFFPAQTWAHKNHIGLINAVSQIRKESGLEIALVFSGKITDYFQEIQKRIVQLGLSDQIHFLGFVSSLELHCLYRLCRCVVIPTRFEAASFPLWEAFYAGSPAACSNVTSLPKQAGNSAMIFDPENTMEMAGIIRRLWADKKLRRELSARGKKNVSRFSWERTARNFRAHYRRILGSELTPEDLAFLNTDPIL
jgi:glycosyltransferase involved in cell wall biosynthesis